MNRIEAEGTKKVRVFDPADGNFIIEIPASAELTMQYFNPTRDDEGAYHRNSPQSARRTRLSVKHNGKQIAVFLGITGFREETKVKMWRQKQRVTVERRLDDDGEGFVQFTGSEKKELMVVSEDEGIPF